MIVALEWLSFSLTSNSNSNKTTWNPAFLFWALSTPFKFHWPGNPDSIPHLNNHIGVALQVRTYSLLSVSELPGDKCTQLHSEGEFTETICYCILTLFSLISMLVLTVFHESFLLFPLRTKLFKRKMKTWYRLNNSLHAVNYIPAL